MSKEPGKTAGELLKELRGDPDVHRRAAEREREQAEYDRLVDPILERLRAIGLNGRDISDVVERHAPLEHEAVEVLRRALKEASEDRLQQAIVRALGAAREPFPGDELVQVFDSAASETQKWVIANTIAEARPKVDPRWLINRLADPNQGKAREMLALAVARMAPTEGLPVLRELLQEIPGHVAPALAEVGGSEEADLLRAQLPGSKGWIRKEIEKAIRKIERRR